MEDIDRFADDWCRYYKKDLDSITSISQFLQFKEFDALDQKIAMPLAASFVKFLIVRYGMENLGDCIRTCGRLSYFGKA